MARPASPAAARTAAVRTAAVRPAAVRPLRALAIALVTAAAVVGPLTACGSGGAAAPGVVTVTVPRPAATPGRTAAAADRSRLDGHCDTLLPLADVQQALHRAFPGRTDFVVGRAQSSIGRVAYLNCRYGIPSVPAGAAAQPLVEVGVSVYRSAAQAAARVRSTVADYLGNGARREDDRVDGRAAVLLSGGVGEGYGADYAAPLLVVADGRRTVAVTLATRAGDVAYRRAALMAVARLALARTGG